MPDASDLGYLLHKHPDRAQQFSVSSVGTAHVFWPEAYAERAACSLLLEVDPVALVRGTGKQRNEAFSLSQYVNDRPYAAGSMLAVALGRVFHTAMSGICKSRQELADSAIPLDVDIPALSCCGDAELVDQLFAPLGWTVQATTTPLDPTVPEWGDSRYLRVRLTGTVRLADALTQLYVLIPALDGTKHYYVGEAEVDVLLRAGAAWLPGHPERSAISSRYLGRRKPLVATAIGRLAELDDLQPEQLDNAVPEPPAEGSEDRPAPLSQLRRGAVLAALKAEGAARVVDLGCGEGALLRDLVADHAFTAIIGADVSARALQIAARRLHLEGLGERQAARIELIQSSATYRDDRLTGYDAVVLMEVIEHVDLPRHAALEAAVFGHARPTSVVVTTPNVEHNVRYETLEPTSLRHHDHRFEWTRAEFGAWAETAAAAYGYAVRFLPVGEIDPEVGPPTQMAVFRRSG
jgi:3' terminal RNA ribose 2'-O-methyltransferase Hen1